MNFMGTQEIGHNVQFVERITTGDEGARSNFLKARRNNELQEDPTTFMLRRSVSDQQPNALGRYETVSTWTNEVAQTQDRESLLPPQNEEMTRAGINGHSRSSCFSVVEMVVLQFLSTSQQCGAIVKVQFGDEPVRACYFRADEQRTASNQLSDERGRCLPLVPTSQAKHAVQSYEVMDRPVAQDTTTSTKRVSASGPARSKKVDVAGIVQKTVDELLGTVVPVDAPLMGAGLDSLSAVDLVQTLGQRLGTELEPAALFDYQTIGSLSKHLSTNLMTEVPQPAPIPDSMPADSEESSKSVWTLYSELDNVNVSGTITQANQLTRPTVIIFAFLFSGSEFLLSRLESHTHLFACHNLCLIPFNTLEERNSTLEQANLEDGLIVAVETLRNCPVLAEVSDFFVSTTDAYRAVQEWASPRILVDGTEAYSAAPRMSFTTAKSLFLQSSFVHLLRNPRECLGEYQHNLAVDDRVELELIWTKFMRQMGEFDEFSLQQVRYEDLTTNLHDSLSLLCSRLSIPTLELPSSMARKKARIYDGPLQRDTRAVAWRLGYKLSQKDTSNFLFINPDAIQGTIIWLQRGDPSKPVLVFLHGLMGTPVAAPL